MGLTNNNDDSSSSSNFRSMALSAFTMLLLDFERCLFNLMGESF